MPFAGFGFGFSSLLWLIAVVVVATVVWRSRGSFVAGTPIVLKSFRVDENPTAAVPIEITGRISGLVSWILTALRLEPEFQLRITRNDASIRSGTLSGLLNIYIPLSAITTTECGYQRSILAFALAVLFSLGFVSNLLSGFFSADRDKVGNDMGLAFGFLILAGIAALVYYLSKRIGLKLETMHSHGVRFKRSVIENISVDLPEALRAIEVLNALVLSARKAQIVVAGAAAPQQNASRLAGQCPRCSEINPPDVRFCESCGSPLD